MKTVLVIHESKHVGGGQTYADNIVKTLKLKKNVHIIYLEGCSNLQVLKSLFTPHLSQVIWNIYTSKYFLPILLSSLLRKKNTLVVYGLWFLESISCRWQKYPFKENVKLFINDTQLFFSQLFVFLLMTEVVHLSVYGKKLYDTYYRFLRKKEKIMYPGIDILFQNSHLDRKIAREKTGLSQNSFILLMLGRIDFRKNYHLAFELLNQLKNKKKYKNAELVFVFSASQEGNDFTFLQFLFKEIKEQQLGSKVKIFTGVKREDISLFYSAADAFLMLSEKFETFGLVTLEALTLGCPVFGFNSSATPEILEKYASRFLSRPHDFLDLISKIETFYKLDNKRRQKIINDLRMNTKRFQWTKSAEILLL